MLKLLSAPATNERGPRYMEKALAAIHQANHLRRPIVFGYGASWQRVGLFFECPDELSQLVCGPITANYPQCSLTTPEPEEVPTDSADDETWSSELSLVPELFPILRHGQFEDQLNRNFADPINGILRAIKADEATRCQVEIVVRPASHRRGHAAIIRRRRPFLLSRCRRPSSQNSKRRASSTQEERTGRSSSVASAFERTAASSASRRKIVAGTERSRRQHAQPFEKVQSEIASQWRT